MGIKVPQHRRQRPISTIQHEIYVVLDRMFSGIRDWFPQMLLLPRSAGELGMLVEDEVVLEPVCVWTLT